MTLITGQVADVGMNNASGVFYARATEFRGDGTTVVSPAPATFTITGGVVSAEVEPGPTIITLHVGPIRKDWFVNVPEADVGLGDLIATYMEYEPAVVSAAIAARDAAIEAESEAKQAAIDAEAKRVAAETAAGLTGADRLHVDGVRALLDETYDQSQAGMALPPRLTETALNATYGEPKADRGGATKADGQNVKNLRRPTLAVDKMFPNARHDHQIVWVDETAKVAYAVSQDNRLYRSTWTIGGDEALVFGTNRSGAAEGIRWATNGVFMRLPNGNLLMEATVGLVGATSLVRSTDDGLTWTTVWTTPGQGKRFLGPQSVARDDATGHLYLVEYTTDVAATTVDIWRSTDQGATWSVWVSKVRSENTGTGFLRHWHSARFDPVSQRMYFLCGDNQVDAGIYRTTADGTGVEAVLRNSDISAQFGVSSPARAVDLMFFPTHIAWASDGSGGPQNHIYRLDRASIGGTPVVERVAATDNTGWYTVRAANDGSAWIVSTSTEVSQVYDADPGVVHLYAVTQNGSQVDQIASIEMGGNAVGYGSISGLGGEAGDGDAFWMRANSYQFYPNRVTSAFQFRARLAFGVVPFIKPSNQRANEYVRQTANWAGTLTAGQSFTFAHTRAGRRLRALSLLEFGARVTTGLFGAARFEIWNATTNTKVYEYSGASWRSDSFSDTAERWASVPTTFGDRDLVEFRVVNTDATNPITCTVNATYGWSWF